MKKFLIAIFLILAMSNLHAEDLTIVSAKIIENNANDFFFYFQLYSEDIDFALTQFNINYESIFVCQNDSFINQFASPLSVGYFIIHPKTFSLPHLHTPSVFLSITVVSFKQPVNAALSRVAATDKSTFVSLLQSANAI